MSLALAGIAAVEEDILVPMVDEALLHPPSQSLTESSALILALRFALCAASCSPRALPRLACLFGSLSAFVVHSFSLSLSSLALSLSLCLSLSVSLPLPLHATWTLSIHHSKSTSFVAVPASTQVRWLEMARHSAAETESSRAYV